jgi:hypothetical protein
MKPIIWLCAALLALPNAYGATKRPLKELIILAIKEGSDSVVRLPRADYLKLKFGYAIKRIGFSPEVSPDKREHVFSVIGDRSSNKFKPVALTWTVTEVDAKTDGKYGSEQEYQLSLKGKLRACMSSSGKPGQVSAKREDINDPGIREGFEAEKLFYEGSAGLAWHK